MSAGRSAQTPFEDSRLIAGYTFEEFVVGPHNRFPHAASQAVAENLGKAYNPLFIYGPVGMGKTHLMQAVGHRVIQKNAAAKVLYVTAEQFMMEVIELLQEGNLQGMRERYRQLDLLLVDDIQFLATSESTQEEFFHTFNELHHSGKQIIMTSDRPPKMLTTLEDRLRSRFEWGLIADIKQTNLETRVAILKKKESHLNGMKLGDDIRLYIASRLKSNIRELEGFLRRVQAYAQLNNQQINLPLVKEIMRELLPPQEWEEGEEAAAAEASAMAEPVLPPPHLGPEGGAPEFAPEPPRTPSPSRLFSAAFRGAVSGRGAFIDGILAGVGVLLGVGVLRGRAAAFRAAAPAAAGSRRPASGGGRSRPRVASARADAAARAAASPPGGAGVLRADLSDHVGADGTHRAASGFRAAAPAASARRGGGRSSRASRSLSPPRRRPPLPRGGGFEELPSHEAPAGAISVAVFFPRGRTAELEKLKQKFQDIIKKAQAQVRDAPGLGSGLPGGPDPVLSVLPGGLPAQAALHRHRPGAAVRRQDPGDHLPPEAPGRLRAQ